MVPVEQPNKLALVKPAPLHHRRKKGLTMKRTTACLFAAVLSLGSVRAQAENDLPQAEITWPGGSGTAEFRIDGDHAKLRVRTPDGKITPLRNVESTDDALAILADERLAFAWPALLAWAGDDLHILRDNDVSRAERALHGAEKPLPVAERERRKAGTSGCVSFSNMSLRLSVQGALQTQLQGYLPKLPRPRSAKIPFIALMSRIFSLRCW